MNPQVVAVSRSPEHTFSKSNESSITLLKDHGIEGDAHAGKTVKHRYLARKDPNRRNILQVHLIHVELLDELNEKGFDVHPGDLGENITTRGIDLLNLPAGTKLHLGGSAVIELTALRHPCDQVEDFQAGLLKEVLFKNEEGKLVRRLGVMGIILHDGVVSPDDLIKIQLPAEPYQALQYTW